MSLQYFSENVFYEAERDRRKPQEARSGPGYRLAECICGLMSFPPVVWLFLCILWDLSGFYSSQENHFSAPLVQTNLSISKHPLIRCFSESEMVSFQENKHLGVVVHLSFLLAYFVHCTPRWIIILLLVWDTWGLLPKLNLGMIHRVSAFPWEC